MADKTIVFTRSIVAQKDISEGDNTAYITQLSKPIILKGVSTKKCQNVLYSIDGMNFTEETTIGDDNVLSMAIVPFWLSGAEIDSEASGNISHSMYLKAFSYILGGRNTTEDMNIDYRISTATDSNNCVNGAYRYLLQYLAKNKNKIEWDTGDLFTSLDADKQESFGGSDFITDNISVDHANYPQYELVIKKQEDANGSILKPSINIPNYNTSTNGITIKQSPYFFLYPEACPPSNGNPDKLIIDNFWRGGGLLTAGKFSKSNKATFMLFIFAVS